MRTNWRTEVYNYQYYHYVYINLISSIDIGGFRGGRGGGGRGGGAPGGWGGNNGGGGGYELQENFSVPSNKVTFC